MTLFSALSPAMKTTMPIRWKLWRRWPGPGGGGRRRTRSSGRQVVAIIEEEVAGFQPVNGRHF